MLHKLLLYLELIILFVIVPLLIRSSYFPGRPVQYLLFGLIYCLIILKLDPEFSWDSVKLQRVRFREFCSTRSLLLHGVLVIGIFAFAFFYEPEHFLSLPLERTNLWLMILLLYPFLSVCPQEFVYRTYFFHRYHPIIGSGAMAITLNAVLFGYSHVIFYSWLSIAFTFVGGAIFAESYLRSKNITVPFLQHAVLGLAVFTAGLGMHFYRIYKG